ncbi:hypothetical protein J4460_08820 [Candidatus Woesearchaeota archaeon]|nr:hypothetical protein [Candidatus Woesearchaeota archaeon]HIH38396.1 hypothetical protein [Candidatus Woesearchaeota archaeon]
MKKMSLEAIMGKTPNSLGGKITRIIKHIDEIASTEPVQVENKIVTNVLSKYGINSSVDDSHRADVADMIYDTFKEHLAERGALPPDEEAADQYIASQIGATREQLRNNTLNDYEIHNESNLRQALRQVVGRYGQNLVATKLQEITESDLGHIDAARSVIDELRAKDDILYARLTPGERITTTEHLRDTMFDYFQEKYQRASEAAMRGRQRKAA